MPSAGSKPQADHWFLAHGLKQVELCLRAIVYPQAEPILITDDDRVCQDASSGAGKLFGLSRDQMIGRRIDDFVEPGMEHQINPLWQSSSHKEHPGSIRLRAADGKFLEAEYRAQGEILPGRHALALRERSVVDKDTWAHDYGVYLFDLDGRILSWYGGAERIYGYQAAEIIGQPVSRLCPGKDALRTKFDEEVKRAVAQGHFGIERWHTKKDGSRFWASELTTALRTESGELQGFARVVRDFSHRHPTDEKLQPAGVIPIRQSTEESAIAGVVSGEFDHIVEANDAFLQMVGYSREDMAAGRFYWPDLTPSEYGHLDELAHEAALRYGACPPFEKEFIRKDGTRVSVVVTLAILNLSPFHWMAIVHLPAAAEAADPTHGSFGEIVGRSVEMKRLLKLVETVAPTDATVLILGETGTGKELIARAIHRLSQRENFPFVTLNCAAIPTGLLESELFGYERGAFTGALSQKIGRFEMAHRGTLFLDEVGDIPLELQPKLLRALQEKCFERLGGTKTIPIDVRLVAATNRNLTQMLTDKLFRADLFYRLKVFPITAPPLRDHPEDIPPLAHYFRQKYARQMGRDIRTISEETMRALRSWPWPGNVRELENFIERSVILTTGTVLHAPLGELRHDEVQATGTLEKMERDFVIRALHEANGVVSAAANRLGVPRTTLHALMQKLRISSKDI